MWQPESHDSITKLVARLLTGSLGPLAEAAHSGLDFVASIITFISVRIARRPADVEHPYGHERFENLSAVVQGMLLFGGEGMITDDDPEEQTKKLKYNRLVSSSVILQNAVDITAVLRNLAVEGYTIRREDLVQLSSYLTGYIKRFGDYVIDLEAAPDPLDSPIPDLAD